MASNVGVRARKILRLSHRVTEVDIDREARVVELIRNNAGHRNIIQVLAHGWLKGSYKAYFIDMELA
jgi:hypothetical protein